MSASPFFFKDQTFAWKHLFYTKVSMATTAAPLGANLKRARSIPLLTVLLFLIYINCVCMVSLSEGSMISMYADGILLCKPIHHPDNYDNLQTVNMM